ncbi:MAG: hypothetical protein JW774_13625 [Candidatus Aureabacteria bacterium]|nr:hypothetical protein [Candidatus Auribacterota bacterium]
MRWSRLILVFLFFLPATHLHSLAPLSRITYDALLKDSAFTNSTAERSALLEKTPDSEPVRFNDGLVGISVEEIGVMKSNIGYTWCCFIDPHQKIYKDAFKKLVRIQRSLVKTMGGENLIIVPPVFFLPDADVPTSAAWIKVYHKWRSIAVENEKPYHGDQLLDFLDSISQAIESDEPLPRNLRSGYHVTIQTVTDFQEALPDDPQFQMEFAAMKGLRAGAIPEGNLTGPFWNLKFGFGMAFSGEGPDGLRPMQELKNRFAERLVPGFKKPEKPGVFHLTLAFPSEREYTKKQFEELHHRFMKLETTTIPSIQILWITLNDFITSNFQRITRYVSFRLTVHTPEIPGEKPSPSTRSA